MGNDLNSYRARIGLFVLTVKPRHRRIKYGVYKGFHNGTDIHFRVLATNMITICLLLSFYGVVAGHCYIQNHLAVSTFNTCEWVAPFVTKSTVLGCPMYGSQYSTYLHRQIILSGDVELNPGPKGQMSDDNFEKLLRAIQQNNDEIRNVQTEVKGVRGEMSLLRNEITRVQDSVKKVELVQNNMALRLDKLEETIEHVKCDHDIVTNDLASLSMHHDEYESRLSTIEQHLNSLESDKLRNSLRIFGLEETETNDSELVSLVEEKVLKTAYGENVSNDCLISAWRVGLKKGPNTCRMVIAKFAKVNDKFGLFHCREKLRHLGIRVSNDLTFQQRQQLKSVRERGLSGYFKNGKLFTYQKANSSDVDHHTSTRIFKRAARPSYRQEASNCISVFDQMEVTSFNTTAINTADDVNASVVD